jgi:hypothetical protein
MREVRKFEISLVIASRKKLVNSQSGIKKA